MGGHGVGGGDSGRSPRLRSEGGKGTGRARVRPRNRTHVDDALHNLQHAGLSLGCIKGCFYYPTEGSSCIISGRICLGGQLVRFWTSHQNRPCRWRTRAVPLTCKPRQAAGCPPSKKYRQPIPSGGAGRPPSLGRRRSKRTVRLTTARLSGGRTSTRANASTTHAAHP